MSRDSCPYHEAALCSSTHTHTDTMEHSLLFLIVEKELPHIFCPSAFDYTFGRHILFNTHTHTRWNTVYYFLLWKRNCPISSAQALLTILLVVIYSSTHTHTMEHCLLLLIVEKELPHIFCPSALDYTFGRRILFNTHTHTHTMEHCLLFLNCGKGIAPHLLPKSF